MKKIGILHNELAQVVASMGHGDQLVIGDAGLPVPQGVPCIDLAVTFGTPMLQTVLDTVLAELCVERVTLAVQTEHANAALWQSVRQYADAENWAVDVCSHDEFNAHEMPARWCARATIHLTPISFYIPECLFNE